MKQSGFKEQVLRAETAAEVDMLLVTFNKFNPPPRAAALARVKRAAKRRVAQLEKQNATEVKKARS